jgi:hypothetical protein
MIANEVTMTENHPIVPPPELRRLWAQQAQRTNPNDPVEWMQYVSEKAAQWGADQELEACCEWLHAEMLLAPIEWGNRLHSARRPKPPSLKEQAQQSLLRLANYSNKLMAEDAADMETIRRALEQIPEDK